MPRRPDCRILATRQGASFSTEHRRTACPFLCIPAHGHRVAAAGACLMSRHERNTPGAPGRRPTANEAEATTTATIIAGLRPRLWRQDILRHPLVRDELQKLLEEVAVLLGQVDPRPGRHRSSAVNMPGQVSDAQGHDLKPDPLAATTPAEFITALWQYRAW